MNKITKAASNIMQSESLEEPIEPHNPEEASQSDQPIEPQIQKPQPPEGQPLSPINRANQAYQLVYGETAKIPIQHESVANAQDADWFIRSYMGSLFAKPNDNPLTQKFENLQQLLTWFDETYPLAETD